MKSFLAKIFIPALICKAYLNITRGNLDQTLETLNNVIELCKPREMHAQMYMSNWVLCILAKMEGDPKKALGLAKKATNIARTIQNPWLEINILQFRTQILKEQNAEYRTEKERIQELVGLIQAGGVPTELEEDFDSFLSKIRID